MFGVKETRLVAAPFMDIDGGDPEARLKEAIDAFVP